MLAHEARRLMTGSEAEPSKRFRRMTCNLQHQPMLFNAEMLQKIEDHLKKGEPGSWMVPKLKNSTP
jgi:hypothetical protein